MPPFSNKPVGQHVENCIFLGVGEKKVTVQPKQSGGSEKGEYTV